MKQYSVSYISLCDKERGMKPFEYFVGRYFVGQPSFIELMVSYSRCRKFNNIEKKAKVLRNTSDE